jgi:hypothetical protein
MNNYIKRAEDAFNSFGSDHTGPRVAGHICKKAHDLERAIGYYRQSKLGDVSDAIRLALRIKKPELAFEICIEHEYFIYARELAHKHNITLEEKVLQRAEAQEDYDQRITTVYHILRGTRPGDEVHNGRWVPQFCNNFAVFSDYVNAIGVARSALAEPEKVKLLDRIVAEATKHYHWSRQSSRSGDDYLEPLSTFDFGTVLEETGHKAAALKTYEVERNETKWHIEYVESGLKLGSFLPNSRGVVRLPREREYLSQLQARIDRLKADEQK